MSKPIPQEAIDTLPNGFTILGWGGEFKVSSRFTGYFFWGYGYSPKQWHKSDCHGTDPMSVYAAPTDSEIVRLNKPRIVQIIHPDAQMGTLSWVVKCGGEQKRSEIPPQISETTLIPEDDAERSKYPIGTYLTEYCPNALLALSKHSYEANEKHNAGEPIHWAKDKSVGSLNRIFRHLFEFSWHYARGEKDKARYHLTAGAWRTNELLERYLTNMEPFNTQD